MGKIRHCPERCHLVSRNLPVELPGLAYIIYRKECFCRFCILFPVVIDDIIEIEIAIHLISSGAYIIIEEKEMQDILIKRPLYCVITQIRASEFAENADYFLKFSLYTFHVEPMRVSGSECFALHPSFS